MGRIWCALPIRRGILPRLIRVLAAIVADVIILRREKVMKLLRDLVFLLRTVRLLMPNNRYRRLRRHYDPGYNHERDKHPVRHKHFGEAGWAETVGEGGFLYRDYASYEEYVEHQKQKIIEIMKVYGGFSLRVLLRQRFDFWQRFRVLELPHDARILCLGARFGTEVEVLRDLGYRNALGTDLEPGPDNPYVVVGDFMHVDAADGSIDMVYSNAVDHAFNLPDFFKEHARILKPDGLAVYDIAMTAPGAFEAVHWGDERNLFTLMLEHFRTVDRLTIDRFWKTTHLRGTRRDTAAAVSQVGSSA